MCRPDKVLPTALWGRRRGLEGSKTDEKRPLIHRQSPRDKVPKGPSRAHKAAAGRRRPGLLRSPRKRNPVGILANQNMKWLETYKCPSCTLCLRDTRHPRGKVGPLECRCCLRRTRRVRTVPRSGIRYRASTRFVPEPQEGSSHLRQAPSWQSGQTPVEGRPRCCLCPQRLRDSSGLGRCRLQYFLAVRGAPQCRSPNTEPSSPRAESPTLLRLGAPTMRHYRFGRREVVSPYAFHL